MGLEEDTALCSRLASYPNFIFPYHKVHSHCLNGHHTVEASGQYSPPFYGFSRFSCGLLFKSVSAAEKEEPSEEHKPDINEHKPNINDVALDLLAKAYISKESGWDRVKSLFQKDHRGKSSLEKEYISVSLVQICVISFFMKYIPSIKLARKEFIREHQATVFRTRIEAVRRMQDHIFLKAAREGASFSAKITIFSAGFLFISQAISAYRNKTSVLEYTVAAGITGSLARLSMGVRGAISGCVVGTVLGSFVGILGWAALTTFGIAQEDRHLEAIKGKLEVERSLVGDGEFQRKLMLAKQELQETPMLSQPVQASD